MAHVNDPHIRSCISSFSLVVIIDPCVPVSGIPSISIPGYTLIYSLRAHCVPFSTRVFGGVLCYIRDPLFSHVSVVQGNEGNDLDQLVIRVGDVVFAFVYIPQPQSSLLSRLEMSPWDALNGELVSLYKTNERFLAIGDFNAHIADRTPPGLTQHRTSTDSRTDSYGNELLSLCSQSGMYILNGDSTYEPSGDPTFYFHDNVGTSVIDYALVSSSIYLDPLSALGFRVHPPIARLDHSPIIVTLDCLFASRPRISRELPYTQIHNKKGQCSGRSSSAGDGDVLLSALMAFAVEGKEVEVIEPLGITPDPVSCASIRRRLSALARSPGFRNDPTLRAEHKRLFADLRTFRRHAYHLRRLDLRDKLLGCQGRRAYWDFIRRVQGSKQIVSTDASDTLDHFKRLLSTFGPASRPPVCSVVNSPVVDGASPVVSSQPLRIPRPSPGTPFWYDVSTIVPELDDPFEPGDISFALRKLKYSAAGEDKVSASTLANFDPEQIAAFFHDLMFVKVLPSSWTRSVLVPIPKARNPSVSQLRGLSIQTCLRRLYSKCLLYRLEKWMDHERTIPHGQSGFRRTYRTTDNLVILRAIHERCVANGTQLFVALLDTHKAFDEVLRDKLFSKLHSMGAHGSLVDMLRRLYSGTTTALRLCGRFSSPFGVDKGVLQGDPLSPLLFIAYIAELDTSDEHDPVLSGQNISELLLADDIALPSCHPVGFQRKLDKASVQLAGVGLRLNPTKSVWLRLGKCRGPSSQYTFFIGDGDSRQAFEEVSAAKYIGFDLIAGSRWNVGPFISRCVSKARCVSTSVLQQRGRLGPMNADFVMRLYHNLVDPYFVFGAEVSFDTNLSQDRLMTQVLVNHARAAMGLPYNCIRLVLFVDNAVLEVPHRRLQLAARYFEYASMVPENRYVSAALRDSMDLSLTHQLGWYWEFQSRLLKILPSFDPTPRRRLGAEVQTMLVENLNEAWRLFVSGSSRLAIHTLLYPEDPTRLRRTAKKLRYLRILSIPGIRAVARLRASAHNLNIERLRRHPKVPKEQRWCPCCPGLVETELHALMFCPDHADDREFFLERLYTLAPALSSKSKRQLLGSTIINPAPNVAACVATFVHKVMERVDARYLVVQ